MRALPHKQDELLKQLNEIESLERKGVSPEKSNINIFLIFITLLVGFSLLVLEATNTFKIPIDSTYLLIAFTLLTGSFTLAYYNHFIGFLLSSLLVLALNFYFGLNNLITISLINFVLIDSFTVFILANQFKRVGYGIGFFLISMKNIYLFYKGFVYSNVISDLIAALIIMSLIGILPVLITFIAKVSRIAKAKEISSQLLALQNEELLNSWLNTYQAAGIAQPPKPQQQNFDTSPPLPQQQAPNASPSQINTKGEQLYTQIYGNKIGD